MNRHSISLNGPWMAQMVVSGAVRTARLNVKTPADWNAWQLEFPGSGELILERKFNWLFPEPAPATVVLHIKSSSVPNACLNNQPIEFSDNESGFSADVADLLRSSNQLELRFQIRETLQDQTLLESVELVCQG